MNGRRVYRAPLSQSLPLPPGWQDMNREELAALADHYRRETRFLRACIWLSLGGMVTACAAIVPLVFALAWHSSRIFGASCALIATSGNAHARRARLGVASQVEGGEAMTGMEIRFDGRTLTLNIATLAARRPKEAEASRYGELVRRALAGPSLRMVVVALSLTADAVHATCVINTDEDCAVLVERLKAALEAIPHEEAAWIERGIIAPTPRYLREQERRRKAQQS